MAKRHFSPVLGAYNLLWKAATPLLKGHRRLKDGFELRLVPEGWPYNAQVQSPAQEEAMQAAQKQGPFDLWIQAASGGEAYLAHELLKELATAAPNLRILCTSCTVQGLEVLQKAQASLAGSFACLCLNYFPLDEKASMSRAVAAVFGACTTGKALVLLETEIWPNLLECCRLAGVNSIIVNARMTEKSLKGYSLIQGTLQGLAPSAIMATAQPDLERFKMLFGPVPEFSLMPNIKFDRLSPSCTQASAGTGACPVLLLASVREEEEPLLQPMLQELLVTVPSAALVVAPRHMHRVQAWQAGLDAGAHSAGKVLLRSRFGQSFPVDIFQPGKVIIWDAFGELEQLYGVASSVFVGGSLAPLGGQNFLEALPHGLSPCIGPSWSNFYWAGEEVFKVNEAGLSLARLCPDAQAVQAALLRDITLGAAQRSDERIKVKDLFREYLAKRQGGTKQSVQNILKFMDK